MSIDELLSGDELINFAQSENNSNIKRIYDVIGAVINILAIAFIVLPIYGKPSGDYSERAVCNNTAVFVLCREGILNSTIKQIKIKCHKFIGNRL